MLPSTLPATYQEGSCSQAWPVAAGAPTAGATSARLATDYVVHHRKADGRSSEKTFKLAIRTLAAGEELEIDRAHSFRQITTRRYYPGAHAIALQVNGILAGPAPFELLPPTALDLP
jgi:hypothetical protein